MKIVPKTKEKELCKAFVYKSYIEEKLKNRERVPLYVFQRLIDSLSTHFNLEKEIKEINEKAIQNTLIRFSNYDFSGYNLKNDVPHYFQSINDSEKSDIPKVPRINYSLESLVRFVFDSISKEINIEERWTGITCVQKAYQYINKYSENNLSKKNKKFLTKYKRSVIATFISMEFDFKYNNVHNSKLYTLSNKDLFQATRHAISKVN